MHIQRRKQMAHFNQTIDFIQTELNCFSAPFFARNQFLRLVHCAAECC